MDLREEFFQSQLPSLYIKTISYANGVLFDEVSHRLSIESQALRNLFFVSHPISHAVSKDVLENKSKYYYSNIQ